MSLKTYIISKILYKLSNEDTNLLRFCLPEPPETFVERDMVLPYLDNRPVPTELTEFNDIWLPKFELACKKKSRYHKIPKYSDPRKSDVLIWKFHHTVMSQKDAGRIANSVDPDQTAPI